MKDYYDSVVLVAIDTLLKEDTPPTHKNLVEVTCLGNKTIIAAIARLEEAGRLRVTRHPRGTPHPHEYQIIDPPNAMDIITMTIHQERKCKE